MIVIVTGGRPLAIGRQTCLASSGKNNKGSKCFHDMRVHSGQLYWNGAIELSTVNATLHRQLPHVALLWPTLLSRRAGGSIEGQGLCVSVPPVAGRCAATLPGDETHLCHCEGECHRLTARGHPLHSTRFTPLAPQGRLCRCRHTAAVGH